MRMAPRREWPFARPTLHRRNHRGDLRNRGRNGPAFQRGKIDTITRSPALRPVTSSAIDDVDGTSRRSPRPRAGSYESLLDELVDARDLASLVEHEDLGSDRLDTALGIDHLPADSEDVMVAGRGFF